MSFFQPANHGNRFIILWYFANNLVDAAFPSLESQPFEPDSVEKPTGEEVEHFPVHVEGVSGGLLKLR